MKKVGIVSCYFQPNYGSMIQALATQMALNKTGYENETIDITGFSGEIRKAKIRYFARAALTSGILLTKLGRVKNAVRKKISAGAYKRHIQTRNERFTAFKEEHFHLSPRYSSLQELGEKSRERYEAVLVGSDQLWLPGNIAADYYTLNWAPEEINKIAYATSFGQRTLPGDTQAKAGAFLKRINHISVREEAGKELVKEMTGRTVPVVCDPTLLFSGEEWLAIQKREPLIPDRYVLCYFLGSNPAHRQFAKRLSRETGCRTVVLPHIDEFVKADEEIGDELLYDADPGDFLNLIRNAAYICTDSFHCTVFSMLYEKEFFFFFRFPERDKRFTNSRLDTLFSVTGVKNRLISGKEEADECLQRKIAYETVKQRLEKIRKKSYDYLKTALADEGNTDL